jgi:hypothetical protein
MEGNLYKWTNYLFGWRERYFVLKGNILYYYYNKGEKPKARIHLSVAQINSTPEDLKFEIDCGMNILYVKAETKEIKDTWIKALRLAKLEGDKNTNNLNSGNFQLQNFNTNHSKLVNENDFNSCNNSPIGDDRILKKINYCVLSSERIMLLNENLNNFINNGGNHDLHKIYENLKVMLNLILNRVNQLLFIPN